MLCIVHYYPPVISKLEAGGQPKRLFDNCDDSNICFSLSEVLLAKRWTEHGDIILNRSSNS